MPASVYVRQAVDGTWRPDGTAVLDDRVAERMLDDVGTALSAIRPSEGARTDLWHEAETHYQVLCRAHHRSGDLGPGVRPPGQLTLDS